MTEEILTEPTVQAQAPVANGGAPERKRLSRGDIQSGQDSGLGKEELDVPEWGGYVVVKGLTGHERDAWEAGMVVNAGTKKQRVTLADTRASLVQKTCINDDGTLQFQPSDIEWLTQKSAASLQRVFLVAQRLSGLSDDDIEEIVTDLKDDPSAVTG
jgi:hypothetical protein